MASGRSARVIGLSDKIQGLKFMQRAAAVEPSASNDKQHSPNGKASKRSGDANDRLSSQPSSSRDGALTNENINSEDGNEEHWTLRTNKPSSFSEASTSSVRIIAQPGWHQWLGQHMQQQHTANDPVDEQQALTTRRSFGTWADGRANGKRNRKGGGSSRSEDEDDYDDEDDDDNEDGSSIDEEEEERSRKSSSSTAGDSKRNLKSKFMKPGSASQRNGSGKIKKEQKGVQDSNKKHQDVSRDSFNSKEGKRKRKQDAPASNPVYGKRAKK